MINFKIVEHEKNKYVRLNLKKLGTPEVRKKILSRLGEYITGYIVKDKLSGQVLHRRTGKLAQSINYVADPNKLQIGSNMAYAAIHEFGGEIAPKRPGGVLVFPLGGKTIFARRVTIPARPYMWPGITESFESGESQRVMDAGMQEIINETQGR